MSNVVLLNWVRGSHNLPGLVLDATANADRVTAIGHEGGIFYDATVTEVAAAVVIAHKRHAQGANEDELQSIMMAGMVSYLSTVVATSTLTSDLLSQVQNKGTHLIGDYASAGLLDAKLNEIGGTAVLATTKTRADSTHYGISKLSVAPAVATTPIAVGQNDPAVTVTAATVAALRALTVVDKTFAIVTADGSMWRGAATSTVTDDGFLSLGAGTGRWLRLDRDIDIQAAVTSATADSTVLYTVPVGFRLAVGVPFWSVSQTFTTATAGAAGLSSSNAGLSTAGDLLGGVTGDLVATLVSTGAYAKGTKGTKIGNPACVLAAGETVIYNQIAGTYTAGTGIAHIPVRVLLAPAA